MRLSLNGWPPLASHLACVLIGASLAHVSGDRGGESEHHPLPARRALLALGTDDALLRGVRQGQAARIARHEPAGVCLVAEARVEVLRLRPQIVIASTLRTSRAMSAAADELAAGKLALVGEVEARSHGPCREQPQVIYGAR